MAGSWPDLPNPRIEYDRDGTRFYSVVGTSVVETPSAMATINDESSGSSWRGSIGAYSALFVFPENMDITHIYLDSNSATGITVQWSNDSTTGLDGTWTTAATITPTVALTETRYRTDIVAVTGLTGIKMLKLSQPSGYFFYSVHLYGKASAGQNLNRLRFWHPTLDDALDNYPAWLDWGNVQQGSSDVRQFRVKNDSPSLNAGGVKVFMQALTESNPTEVSQHTLSSDNVTFVPSATPGLAVGTLNAQAISGLLYIKRNTLTTAQLSLWRQRLVAAADTWS